MNTSATTLPPRHSNVERQSATSGDAETSSLNPARAAEHGKQEQQCGAADLGVDLEEHIAFCFEAMKGIAKELGLAGTKS
jgi:hypothetical protein